MITIGQTVTRVASDYTNGRVGRVIELDLRKPRARVSWEREANGKPMKLRTWVRLADLNGALGASQNQTPSTKSEN